MYSVERRYRVYSVQRRYRVYEGFFIPLIKVENAGTVTLAAFVAAVSPYPSKASKDESDIAVTAASAAAMTFETAKSTGDEG